MELFLPKSCIHIEQLTDGGYPQPLTETLSGAILLLTASAGAGVDEDTETGDRGRYWTYTCSHSATSPVHPSLQDDHPHSLRPESENLAKEEDSIAKEDAL